MTSVTVGYFDPADLFCFLMVKAWFLPLLGAVTVFTHL